MIKSVAQLTSWQEEKIKTIIDKIQEITADLSPQQKIPFCSLHFVNKKCNRTNLRLSL